MRVLVWIYDVRKWELIDHWKFKLDNETTIVLHAGFRFDGASIPRPLWFLLNPIGLLLIQGLIHDYGYRYQQLWKIDASGKKVVPYRKGESKIYWDRLFWTVGKQVNGMSIVDSLAFLAVFLGGCLAWRGNRKRMDAVVRPLL